MKALGYVRAEDQLPDHAVAPDGPLELAPLLGPWHATDVDTTGIMRLELREQVGKLLVRAFGADEIESRDWGEVEGTRYGERVTATDAVAFAATFDFGFLITILTGYLNRGVLVVDTFNTFTDHSGRASYFSREFFHR